MRKMKKCSDTKSQVKGVTLTPEAKRALAEAAERRAAGDGGQVSPREKGGPKGEEPTRFGDWERKGIAYDF